MENSYLVIKRKEGDSLKLQIPDSNGTVTEINIDLVKSGAQVKLGIEAPKNVTILRHEVASKTNK